MVIEPGDLIRVGVIARSHGLRGEMKVRTLTDFPSRFLELSRIFLIPVDGRESRPARIERARIQGGIVLLKLEGIDSQAEAEAYIGYELAIPRDECAELPPDSYFVFDLIGMKVVLSNGEEAGVVRDVQSISDQDLLVVETEHGKEVLIPLVSEIVTDLSLEKRQIKVSDLPGLFDTNSR